MFLLYDHKSEVLLRYSRDRDAGRVRKMVLGLVRASRSVLVRRYSFSTPLVESSSLIFSYAEDSGSSGVSHLRGVQTAESPSFHPSRSARIAATDHRLWQQGHFELVDRFPRSLLFSVALSSSSEKGERQQDGGDDRQHEAPVSNASWVEKHVPRFLQPYALLARLDKPIGTWLLAWPCAWY